MKKLNIPVVIVALVALTAATASADFWDDYDRQPNQFVDRIEYWTLDGQPGGILDATPITENNPLIYTHTITEFDIPDDYLVTGAWLSLDFTNPDGLLNEEKLDFRGGDGFKLTGWGEYDHREFVRFAYDGSGWVELGEDDGGQYNYDLYLDLDVLNDDGTLTVTVGVRNELGTGDVWLDHSVLYGNVARVPVPGAALLGVLGLGAAGLKLRRRKSA